MGTEATRPVTAPARRRGGLLRNTGGWRVLLARLLVNAVVLALVILILPGIELTGGYRVLDLLVLAALLGLLNAFVKPLLQLLALPFLIESFGLVVVLMNTVILWLLDVLDLGLLEIDGFLWALAGGALLGLFSFLLDNLFGLVPPIVDDQADAGEGSS